MTCELFLVSPYRMLAHTRPALSDAEMLAFLSAYTSLWHPAALALADARPRIVSPYDHEQPAAGCVYAVPEAPRLFQPEDWPQRVADVDAVSFPASLDRRVTLRALEQALARRGPNVVPTLTPEQIRPFLGLGLGCIVLEAVLETMDHDDVLDHGGFWQQTQQAAAMLIENPADEGWRRPLQGAADQLLAAREVIYPVNIHIVDVCLVQEKAAEFPPAQLSPFPFSVVATGQALERLKRHDSHVFESLSDSVTRRHATLCGGPFTASNPRLASLESALFNVRRGLVAVHDLLATEVSVFAAGEMRDAPNDRLMLAAGLRRAIDWSAGGTRRRAANSAHPLADGGNARFFTREPKPADAARTYFELAYDLHETIMHDASAVLVVGHSGTAALPYYQDWLELTRLAPVLGRLATIASYLDETAPDESDPGGAPAAETPDSGPARTATPSSSRRFLDATWTLAGLASGVSASVSASASPLTDLEELERQIEQTAGEVREIDVHLAVAARSLADRLLVRAPPGEGCLIVNPCGVARRVGLECEARLAPPSDAGLPVLACQIAGDRAYLVVDVPAFGFAWWPTGGSPPSAPEKSLTAGMTLANDILEAEVDTITGGLRGLWDRRSGVSRLGQQVVFESGSRMECKRVRITATGPAMGEITSEGTLRDRQDQALANFRQRFRVWHGRPLLELRLELEQLTPLDQDRSCPFAVRFAWRNPHANLFRGELGASVPVSGDRSMTADFVEIHDDRRITAILPGDQTAWRGHGERMLDLALQGASSVVCEIGIALDRPYPMQTALAWSTPAPVVSVSNGPPHVGRAGWLFHLDSPHVAITSLRPSEDHDAVVATLVELGRYGGQVRLRCPRRPVAARFVDVLGRPVAPAEVDDDAVVFALGPNAIALLRVDFACPAF